MFEIRKDITDANTPVYTISTAAHLLGISIPTLRMYEKEGLIIPYKKESNQRRYSQNDLYRVKCIRETINGTKISIQGIKHLLSLIPFWKIKNCSTDERAVCEAFISHDKPCWMYPHKNNLCSEIPCISCEVYTKLSDCKKVKETIKIYL
ncbi:MAG: MerR family transcriptional regulator [Ignavibacteria bacterium CG_4_8_14_3_um_filter_37_9]|nr:MAG: MerR family transcriptional regulator [Ignavibacteria bacterium CG_4_8_14_3_um_filter_37_9]